MDSAVGDAISLDDATTDTPGSDTDVDPSALRITSIEIRDLEATSAEFYFEVNQPVRAFVRYDTEAGALSEETPGEMSFNFMNHRQAVTGLSPATTYFYVVEVENEAGEMVMSVEQSFATPGVTSVPGWPEGTDETQPYAGIFVGNYMAGYVAGNSRLSNEHARSFLAQKTGTLEQFSYDNRSLTRRNIADRCADSSV